MLEWSVKIDLAFHAVAEVKLQLTTIKRFSRVKTKKPISLCGTLIHYGE